MFPQLLVNILTPRNKQQSFETNFFQKPTNPPTQTLEATPHVSANPHKHWWQGLDLNQGPSGYEPDLDVVYKQNKKETVSLKEVCNETYGSVVEAVSELMEEGEKAYSF